MSGAKVLDFGIGPDLENFNFPDLEKYLEQKLSSIKSLPDLESLIKLMKSYLRDKRFGENEQTVLKRLRQRAYDRKRNPQFLKPRSVTSDRAAKIPITKSSDPDLAHKTKAQPIFQIKEAAKGVCVEQIQKTASFSEGVLKALSSIDGEQFIKTAPKMLAWFAATTVVSIFLWQQSVSLYETAGFTNSIYAAAGGILMIVGFAAYHSISRSWLALFFCLYAGVYEGYLMVSGTIENEHQIQIQTIQINPDLVFLKEKAARSLEHYHELKRRYDNPESKVFKNDWFLKTQLNPAWQESLADHNELTTKKDAFSAIYGAGHVTWLKILYRLGLVFLCMMLVHRFFAILVKLHENQAIKN